MSQSKESAVIDRIKHKLEASESELKEKQEHFNLITRDLIEQLETLTGFFQIMYNNSHTLSPAEIKEFASRMDVSVKNMLLSAGNIMEWEKIREGKVKAKPELIDVHAAIKENIYFFSHIAARKNITAISIVDKDLKALADREHFDYIIRNLISNSIKFTQEGGNIDISAKEAGNKLKITVEDDGLGISDQIMDKLFDPETHFTSPGTNHEKGNGYGLFTTKKLVELQGGRINIESEHHIGTRVSFTLPVYREGED